MFSVLPMRVCGPVAARPPAAAASRPSLLSPPSIPQPSPRLSPPSPATMRLAASVLRASPKLCPCVPRPSEPALPSAGARAERAPPHLPPATAGLTQLCTSCCPLARRSSSLLAQRMSASSLRSFSSSLIFNAGQSAVARATTPALAPPPIWAPVTLRRPGQLADPLELLPILPHLAPWQRPSRSPTWCVPRKRLPILQATVR